MTIGGFILNALSPALVLLPHQMDTPAARVLVTAIVLQESDLCVRTQMCNGPARGLAQFERVGVQGVFDDHRTHDLAVSVCAALGVEANADAVYASLSTNDVLAAAFARLLLWSDPNSLPALGDTDGAWQTYLRNWRPGKPRPHDWPLNYSKALAVVTGDTNA